MKQYFSGEGLDESTVPLTRSPFMAPMSPHSDVKVVERAKAESWSKVICCKLAHSLRSRSADLTERSESSYCKEQFVWNMEDLLSLESRHALHTM